MKIGIGEGTVNTGRWRLGWRLIGARDRFDRSQSWIQDLGSHASKLHSDGDLLATTEGVGLLTDFCFRCILVLLILQCNNSWPRASLVAISYAWFSCRILKLRINHHSSVLLCLGTFSLFWFLIAFAALLALIAMIVWDCSDASRKCGFSSFQLLSIILAVPLGFCVRLRPLRVFDLCD